MSNALSILNKHFATIPLNNLPRQATAYLHPILACQEVIARSEKRVVFFGAFKAGKSTLLNAIIGDDMLPSRVNRATGTITRIGYGPTLSAMVTSKTRHGRNERPIPIDDIAKYILLDLSERIARAPEDVEAVSINIPLEILAHCTLVDTPGLRDNERLTQRAYEEIAKADLAVMVLSANQLLSTDEKDAAEKVHSLLNGNIVFVVNRLDQVDEDEREEVLYWARDLLDELGNSLVGQPNVFATEAKPTLEARKNGMTAEHATSGLLAFEQWLKKLFNTDVGHKVVLLSRLGILENHLVEATGHLRSQLRQTQASMTYLQAEAEKKQLSQSQLFKEKFRGIRLELSQVKHKFDSFGERFVDDCIDHATQVMESDSEPATEEKLKTGVEAALQTYCSTIESEANAIMTQIEYQSPPFALAELTGQANFSIATDISAMIGMVIGGIVGGVVTRGRGAVLGVLVGTWIGKSVFGVDITKKTLASIDQAARQLLPTLTTEATQYINNVEIELNHFYELNKPNMLPSPRLLALQRTEQSYKRALKWCAEFQDTINQIKRSLR